MNDKEAQTLVENILTKQDIENACMQNFNFFAMLALPEVCRYAFPGFYLALFSMIVNCMGMLKDFSKYAIGFPRGHAKTIWLKLVVCWIILFTKKKYILVACATESHAKRFIKDVIDILESANILSTFGAWNSDIDTNQAEYKFFNFRGRKIVLHGVGAGTAVRGANAGAARPDVIICDDAQTRECADSFAEATTFATWFYGTLLKSKSPDGCLYMYVGNMYPDREFPQKKGQYTCMLRNLKNSSQWKSHIVGAILNDGSALWEELHSLSALLDEYHGDVEAGYGEIYCAEVLNDPSMKPLFALNANLMRTVPADSPDLHMGNFIIIDPAGRKVNSNETVLAYFEVYDGVPVCRDLVRGVWSPGQCITEAIKLALGNSCNLIVVEDVAYQETLLYWFEVICMQQRIFGLQFLPINPGGESKNSRIVKGFLAANAGELAFTAYTKAVYLDQAQNFKAQSKNNVDDVLDVIAYAPKVLKLYSHLMIIQGGGGKQLPNHANTMDADEAESCF